MPAVRTHRTLATAAAAAVALLAASPAAAQDPVDIGVIKDSEVRVVQKMLYPKEGRTEFGLHLGVMPFDAYLTTPNLQLSFDLHMSETFGITVLAGGGYGLPNSTLNELKGPAYNVSPDAYRYLASVVGGVEWAPIYGKMNLNGARVMHYDVYFPLRGGISLEQSILQDGGTAVAPTVEAGVGARFFAGERMAIRAELHDAVLMEPRQLTSNIFIKQNVNVMLGMTFLSKTKGR
jgi:outer membrane beta-barrel protein